MQLSTLVDANPWEKRGRKKERQGVHRLPFGVAIYAGNSVEIGGRSRPGTKADSTADVSLGDCQAKGLQVGVFIRHTLSLLHFATHPSTWNERQVQWHTNTVPNIHGLYRIILPHRLTASTACMYVQRVAHLSYCASVEIKYLRRMYVCMCVCILRKTVATCAYDNRVAVCHCFFLLPSLSFFSIFPVPVGRPAERRRLLKATCMRVCV